jgi:hypothetical protein
LIENARKLASREAGRVLYHSDYCGWTAAR